MPLKSDVILLLFIYLKSGNKKKSNNKHFTVLKSIKFYATQSITKFLTPSIYVFEKKQFESIENLFIYRQ